MVLPEGKLGPADCGTWESWPVSLSCPLSQIAVGTNRGSGHARRTQPECQPLSIAGGKEGKSPVKSCLDEAPLAGMVCTCYGHGREPLPQETAGRELVLICVLRVMPRQHWMSNRGRVDRRNQVLHTCVEVRAARVTAGPVQLNTLRLPCHGTSADTAPIIPQRA